MDHKAIFIQFKARNVKAGDVFSFSLFPVLFEELKSYGIDSSFITGQFSDDFNEVFLPNERTGVLLQSIEYIKYYRDLILPVSAEVKKSEPVPELVVAAPVSVSTPNKTEPIVQDYNDAIPPESEDGDPFYTPEDQRIDLKPEDCADKQYDHEWLKRIGAVGYEE